MDFADGRGDLKFSHDGRTVTGAEMGRPLRELMAMSKEAGRPVTAERLRAMTAEQQAKLDCGKASADQRPRTVEVELEDRGRGIHRH